jgi:exopolysaccharide biosynthesis polyprenyl glycosylphosphotransferase
MKEEIIRAIAPLYNIKGYVAWRTEKRKHPPGSQGIPFLGGLEELDRAMSEGKIREVMVLDAHIPRKVLLTICRICERNRVRYKLLADLTQVLSVGQNILLDNWIPIFQYGSPTIKGWNCLFKRLFDVTVAAIALVLLFPFFCILCLIIRLDSPGWPIFTQIRLGRNGKPFKIFKFRTMIKGAENGAKLTEKDDKRITRIGRILRHLSIDELPQLLNVLKGDMSLVGPRAVIPMVAESYSEHELLSLNVVPGMTGLAQVKGRDNLSFRAKSIFNIVYIQNYSLFLDLKILLKTIPAVLSREGTDGTRMD